MFIWKPCQGVFILAQQMCSFYQHVVVSGLCTTPLPTAFSINLSKIFFFFFSTVPSVSSFPDGPALQQQQDMDQFNLVFPACLADLAETPHHLYAAKLCAEIMREENNTLRRADAQKSKCYKEQPLCGASPPHCWRSGGWAQLVVTPW